MENKGEIILYQPNEEVRLEVRLENETVWLTQAQMAELFQRERTVITKHINNVFKEKELEEKSNVHFLHIANSDKPVKYYSLDVIISVGYRVKSQRGTQFRQWANKLVLIDNYVDESVLTLFTKRQEGVKALIYTQRITSQFRLDLERHNAQYLPIEVKEIRNVHDRFLILDQAEVYHIGASLKDLGKKLFAFSRLHIPAEEILRGIENSEVNVERENLV